MSIKTAWRMVVLLSLACLFLWLGLVQPFQAVQQESYIIANQIGIVLLKTESGWVIFPAPPDLYLPVHTRVSLDCNQGKWIPVLFDCKNTIHLPSPHSPTVEL